MHLRFLLPDESFRLVGAAGEGPAQQELSLVLARKELLGDEKDEGSHQNNIYFATFSAPVRETK